jgi:hypothetical protein
MLLVGSGSALASDTFSDVPTNSMFHDEINDLAARGITEGFDVGAAQPEYRPNADITRQAIIAFAYRVAGEPTGNFSEPFSDIDCDDQGNDDFMFCDAVEWAFSNGVTEGFDTDGDGQGDEFRPNLKTTREAFTAFVYRLAGEPAGPFADPGFSDVDSSNMFFDAIAWAAENNVVNGFDTDNDGDGDVFRPRSPITRQAVAALVIRAINQGFIGQQAAGTSVTTSPELLSVSIESQSSSATTVRFTFDEAVTGKQPVANLFYANAFDGTRVAAASSARVDQNDTSDVLATFNVSQERFGDTTVATVDRNAVQDSNNQTNPEGDAPVNPAQVQGGSTNAPDLQSLTNFNPTADTVDFVFDEAVATTDASVQNGGFQLVLTDGSTLDSSAAQANPGGNNPNVVRVTFQNQQGTRPQGNISSSTESDTARGVARENVVDDTSSSSNRNPLQAADVSNSGNSSDPDLVSVNIDAGNTRAEYTFDEPVQVNTATADFRLYDRNGDEMMGTSPTQSASDPSTIFVTFPANQLRAAVGASVDFNSVQGTTGAAGRDNERDEVPVTGQMFEAGRTTTADLIDVRVEPGTNDQLRVVYVFDETVATSPNAMNFYIYNADGDRTAGMNAQRNDNNTAEVFVQFGANNDVRIQRAVLATVDNNAVQDSGTGGGTPNIEGAVVVE